MERDPTLLPRAVTCEPLMEARRAAAEQRLEKEERAAGESPADPPARRPLAILPSPLLLLAVGAAVLAQVGCRGPVAVYGGPPIPRPAPTASATGPSPTILPSGTPHRARPTSGIPSH